MSSEDFLNELEEKVNEDSFDVEEGSDDVEEDDGESEEIESFDDDVEIDFYSMDSGDTTDCDLCHDEMKRCEECIVMPEELPYDYKVLNPCQTKGAKAIQDGKNSILVTSKTGSGKTIILEIGIMNWLANREDDDEIAVVILPLKMLSRQQYERWSELFEDVNLMNLTGDTKEDIIENSEYGGTDVEKIQYEMIDADIVMTTYEMFESFSTKKDEVGVLDNIGFIGVDEIHNIGDDTRGGQLEGALIRYFLYHNEYRRAKLIMLSATFDNVRDLKSLVEEHEYDTEVVADKWTPTKRIYHSPEPYNNRDRKFKEKLIEILENNPDEYVMGLVYSRGCVDKTVNELNTYFDEEIAVGHHAGKSPSLKNGNEKKYMSDDNNIRCLVATPTIAMGVNLKGDFMVIVSDYFDGMTKENKPLTKMEIEQIGGRAGRPQFSDDKVAHVYTLIRNDLFNEFKKEMEKDIHVNGTLYENLDLVLTEELHKRSDASINEIERWLDSSYSEITSSERRNLDETIEWLEDKGYINISGDMMYNTIKGKASAVTMVRPFLMEDCIKLLERYEDEYSVFNSRRAIKFAEEFYNTKYSQNISDVEKRIKEVWSYSFMLDDNNLIQWNYSSPDWGVYNKIEDDFGRIGMALNMFMDMDSIIMVEALGEMKPVELYRLKEKLHNFGVKGVGEKRLALLYVNGIDADVLSDGVDDSDIPRELMYPSRIMDFGRGLIDELRGLNVLERHPDNAFNTYPSGKWEKDRRKILEG